jgi:predicted nucleotidyltransferase
MAKLIHNKKAIELESANSLEKKEEWRPWKKYGFRFADADGTTVWHEREILRQKVLQVFAQFDVDLFLFGSRAGKEEGVHSRSDYDIGYFGDSLPSASQLAELKETFEELPIPAHVDLVDFAQVTTQFKRLVLESKKVEIWKQRSKNSLFT